MMLKNLLKLKNTVIRVQTDAEPISMTCKEALESGIVPNKFVAYYLGILTEFYEKTALTSQKVDLEN